MVDIERLAREANGDIEWYMTNPPHVACYHMSPEKLARFAALVLEEAAKVCDDVALRRLGSASAPTCAAAIRALKPKE
jgi:hypothetical protein